MGTRGPKSEAEKKQGTLSLPGLSGKRPKPPSSMSAEAKKIWKTIVESLPSSHFRPGDHPLLVAYCEAIVLHNEATEALKKEGAVLKISKMIFDSETGQAKEVVLRSQKNPWVEVQNIAGNRMSQLATKLRLAVNSRISNAKAAFEKPESPPSHSNRKGLMFGGQ